MKKVLVTLLIFAAALAAAWGVYQVRTGGVHAPYVSPENGAHYPTAPFDADFHQRGRYAASDKGDPCTEANIFADWSGAKKIAYPDGSDAYFTADVTSSSIDIKLNDRTSMYGAKVVLSNGKTVYYYALDGAAIHTKPDGKYDANTTYKSVHVCGFTG